MDSLKIKSSASTQLLNAFANAQERNPYGSKAQIAYYRRKLTEYNPAFGKSSGAYIARFPYTNEMVVKCNTGTRWTTPEYPMTREGYRALMRDARLKGWKLS